MIEFLHRKSFLLFIFLLLYFHYLFAQAGYKMQTENISSMHKKTSSANVIFSDYPDPDIIRVDDTYYMVSTTMYFMPGCVILRSYNLVDWEIASYVYEQLDDKKLVLSFNRVIEHGLINGNPINPELNIIVNDHNKGISANYIETRDNGGYTLRRIR